MPITRDGLVINGFLLDDPVLRFSEIALSRMHFELAQAAFIVTGDSGGQFPVDVTYSVDTLWRAIKQEQVTRGSRGNTRPLLVKPENLSQPSELIKLLLVLLRLVWEQCYMAEGDMPNVEACVLLQQLDGNTYIHCSG